MKRTFTFLFSILLAAISLSSCGEKEICYECTRESQSGTHTITNCSDKVQIKIWRSEAEKRDYKCIEK